ncbi:MAG: NAD(+) synthase [Lachnospiraceae bacterium]|nr:NAD(+) synthase [Lachnospiraceae bacterium]
MNNQLIRVVAAVPQLKVGDVRFNTEQIIAMIREQSDSGVIVFPELAVTGYTCADLFLSDLLLQEAEKALAQIAEATERTGVTAVVGVPVRYRNSLYNCGAVISCGSVRALVPKTYLPNYSEFYECRWFASGRGITGASVLVGGQEVPFGTDILAEDPVTEAVLGVELCEDLWVPDKPSTHAALAGATIIANLSASDELIGKQEYRRELVKQQSGSCYCAYIYASAGTQESSTDLVFSGHAVIAQNGSVFAESVFPEYPHAEQAVIDLGVILHDRRRQNTFENVGSAQAGSAQAGSEAYAGCGTGSAGATYRRVPVRIQAIGADEVSAEELTEQLNHYGYSVARNPFVPADNSERDARCRRILQIQANGLATRVRATGIRNLVIGISGGLDSTLALLVCAEAKKLVPGIRIIAYTMPNEGNTTGRTYTNACRLMELLADESHEVPINEGVKLHLAQLGHEQTYQGEGDVTYENAQARMRTYILMDAANMKQGLVVGTGDLSELALGWCTYNGDHMSMYAVNSSVPKTLVQFICCTYADMCGNKELQAVLLDICDTPITPELAPSVGGQIAQKTEEKIGKYDLNDFFLFYTLRYGFEPLKTVAFACRAYPELTENDVREAARMFFRRFFTQQFKRSCLPDGPKVGSVTLSPRGDWRMPSDASVALWLEELEQRR